MFVCAENVREQQVGVPHDAAGADAAAAADKAVADDDARNAAAAAALHAKLPAAEQQQRQQQEQQHVGHIPQNSDNRLVDNRRGDNQDPRLLLQQNADVHGRPPMAVDNAAAAALNKEHFRDGQGREEAVDNENRHAAAML